MGYSESDLVIKSDQMAQPSIQLSTFRTNLKSTDGASIISTSRILRGCLNCASSKEYQLSTARVLRHCSMIRQPKSGDCNFPKEQGLTSKHSDILIGNANNVLLYCFHLEALIRSVFSPHGGCINLIPPISYFLESLAGADGARLNRFLP